MAFTFEPFGDRVLVQFEDIKAKYGVLDLPDDRGESTRVSRVIRVGSGVKNPKIAPGARVVTTVHAGLNVYAPKYGDIDQSKKIMVEAEILGLFEEQNG